MHSSMRATSTFSTGVVVMIACFGDVVKAAAAEWSTDYNRGRNCVKQST